MKCEICQGRTRLLKDQEYRYIESGLNHVYLQGVDVEFCEECNEKSPLIPRILELHSVIGWNLALQPTTLRGTAIKFMRKQLGMRAREWAELMRVDVSTFSRWENDEQVLGPQSDTLLRLLYFYICEQRDGGMLPAQLVHRLATDPRYGSDEVEIVVDVKTFRANFRIQGAVHHATVTSAMEVLGLSGSAGAMTAGVGHGILQGHRGSELTAVVIQNPPGLAANSNELALAA